VFGKSEKTYFNNTKSFIGHAMGAAGALELAGNLPSFDDGVCHATINVDELDPKCALPGLVANSRARSGESEYILNNSFGMLGINSVVIIR
jgi:3-oxoacyl-[acyl-carrier-protein] synthase II